MDKIAEEKKNSRRENDIENDEKIENLLHEDESNDEWNRSKPKGMKFACQR